MKLTRKRGWDFCFIELLFQTQNQSLDEGCSTVGVRQTQTADLQTRRPADRQTCRPADLPFPINFENNNGATFAVFPSHICHFVPLNPGWVEPISQPAFKMITLQLLRMLELYNSILHSCLPLNRLERLWRPSDACLSCNYGFVVLKMTQ